MRLLAMALRNLARNRRRTLLSLAVIAAGTVGIVLTAGFIRFSFDGLREALIHGGLGHLEVVAAAAVGDPGQLDRPLAEGLEEWRSLQAEIEALPRVRAAAPTLQLMGMATAGERTVSFVGLGVDPERERRMGFDVRLREGEDLPASAPAEGDDRVLLASGIARSLAAAPGDVVTLLAIGPDGMLNALDLTVAGIFSTGVQDLDTRFLKVHRETAGRLLQTGRVSNLLVGLDDTGATEEVAARVRDLVAGREPALAVIPWTERAPFFGQVRNLYLGIFWFLGSIIFVLVVLSVSNTLLMAVMERVREIGTLRAIGTSRRQVAAILLAEAFWLGLLGGLLGDLLGWGTILLVNALDLKMPPPPGAVSPIDLKLTLVPEALAGSVVLMVAVLAVAAVAPTLRAVRLRIVEALAHV